MAISDTLRDGVDKMNVYAQRALVGTAIQNLENTVAGVVRGTHIIDSDEATAEAVVIDTGITVNGWLVQIYRSNILLASYDVQAATTILTIATNSTDYVVTENDVINYEVY